MSCLSCTLWQLDPAEVCFFFLSLQGPLLFSLKHWGQHLGVGAIAMLFIVLHKNTYIHKRHITDALRQSTELKQAAVRETRDNFLSSKIWLGLAQTTKGGTRMPLGITISVSYNDKGIVSVTSWLTCFTQHLFVSLIPSFKLVSASSDQPCVSHSQNVRLVDGWLHLKSSIAQGIAGFMLT